jgi:TatD DNase family protein
MVDSFSRLGLYFSFGGPCTFKNANKVVQSVQRVPATRLLSETDCPYLTPVPHRGEFPNQPKYVVHAVEKMAEIRNQSMEALEKQIEENAKRLFFKLK